MRFTAAAIAATVVIVAAGAWFGLRGQFVGMPGIPAPSVAKAGLPQPVYTAPAHIEVFGDRLEAIGTLLANESITVTAKIQGVIRTLDFEDGRAVEKGAQIASIASAEEDARVSAELANLDEQRKTLSRISVLAKSSNATPARLDEQVAAVRKAEANLAAAQAHAGDFRIQAAFGGVLGTRRVSAGALVTPGTVITTLDDMSVMKLDFSIPENFVASLKPGLDVEATSDAYPDQVFAGKVASIDSRVDPITRSISVRALLPNPELKLKPGMLLIVELIKDRRRSLMIPEQALMPIDKREFVNTVSPSGEIARVEVRIGRRRPGSVEVLSGLKEDDQVVTEGSMMLRPGAHVRIVSADAGTPR